MTARPALARLVRSEDFERVLKARSRHQSTHFAVHHLRASPSRPPRRGPRPSGEAAASTVPQASDARLSTGPEPLPTPPVDPIPIAVWFGTVVPKRHARRSVTRSLLKRQIRAAVGRHAERLARGLWVVRLRAPFDRTRYPSAASEAMKIAARDELDALLARAAAPVAA